MKTKPHPCSDEANAPQWPNLETQRSEAQPTHSPLPWTYFVGNADGRGLIRIEQEGTGVHVASMPRGRTSEANAALIVRACNNAERLAEALNNIIGKIEVMHGCMEVNYEAGHGECYPEFDVAREALAQWEAGL